jgi:hypothetical protein
MTYAGTSDHLFYKKLAGMQATLDHPATDWKPSALAHTPKQPSPRDNIQTFLPWPLLPEPHQRIELATAADNQIVT